MIPELRYLAAALALKGFGATYVTRRLYRFLGNTFGQGRHAVASATDLQRGFWLCQQVRDLRPGFDEKAVVLELGTGWTHFYGIFLRLFFDSKTVLFDVQDNRQLDALRNRFASLSVLLSGQHQTPDFRHDLLRQISRVESFDELYRLLDMKYEVEPNGDFASAIEGGFDVVFSIDVLEHVERSALPALIAGVYRVLKPGGISIHQIGLDDHLSHYATGMPSKNYLRYSDRTWRVLFDNRIQHFNRLQLPEFEALFQKSSFQYVQRQMENDPTLLTRITPHPQFGRFDVNTLKATRAYLIHRKLSV